MHGFGLRALIAAPWVATLVLWVGCLQLFLVMALFGILRTLLVAISEPPGKFQSMGSEMWWGYRLCNMNGAGSHV